MRNLVLLKTFFRAGILLLIGITCFNVHASETRTIQVGSGNVYSEVFPIHNWWLNSFQGNEVIYYADELGLEIGDCITALSYHCVESSAYGGNFNVRIKNINATSFESNGDFYEDPSILFVNYEDQVYGNVQLSSYSAGDWITFPLSKPFLYQGGNIVVDIRNTATYYRSGWCYFAGFDDDVNTHRSIVWRNAKDEQISGFNPGSSPTSGSQGDQGFYPSGPYCPNTRITYITESDVTATSLTLNHTFVGVPEGKTTQLIAIVKPENVTNPSVIWTSSDNSIATVDENGLVRGINSGITSIIAQTADGSNLVAACAVQVCPIGDVDLNGFVDVEDVNAAINIILKVKTPEDYLGDADVTGDGMIDVEDVNEMINIILKVDNNKPEIFTVNGVSFKMIPIKGGTFTMGATIEQSDDAEDDEYPTHQVTLSKYSIGETEVTQELWQAVMGSNPSNHTGNLEYPVEEVTWNDCQEFITKLNQLTGKNFRLPTEAEWEYAARGGNKNKGYKYSGSNNVDDVAWYNCGATHIVAQKTPNELGLYDMSGNVEEYCYDWYGTYSSEAQVNPIGPVSGSIHVDRGGSYLSGDSDCRVSRRDNGTSPIGNPLGPDPDLGFRLAMGDLPNMPVVPDNPDVPNDYEQVDWIESQNTNSGFSYINTGFIPSLNTRVEFKTMLPKDRSLKTHYGNYSLFGAHSWTSRSGMYGYGGSLCFEINGSIRNEEVCSVISPEQTYSSTESFEIHSSEISNLHTLGFIHIDDFASNDNFDHVFEGNISINSMYLEHNGNKVLDWQPTTYWNGLDGTDATCSVLYLFTGVWEPNLYAIDNGQPRGFITQRLYEFKIYESDVLIHNYIPVMRKQDNVYGLYDSVNKTFLTSPNGVSFTGGNDTPIIPEEYEQVDWIESHNSNNGFSYINTGFIPTVNTRIEFKTMLPEDRSLNTHYGNYSLFGAHSWTSRSGMYGYGGSLCFEINGSTRNYNIPSNQAILTEQGDFLFKEGLQIHASECSEVYPLNWLHIDNFASDDSYDHVFEGNISTSKIYLKHNGNELLDWQPNTYWDGLDGTDATCSVLYLFTGVWEPNLYAIDNGQPRGFITQRLYEFKIYESDVLVHNYIPVMRKQDNIYGLYDSVSKTFLTSPNGVSFTGAND